MNQTLPVALLSTQHTDTHPTRTFCHQQMMAKGPWAHNKVMNLLPSILWLNFTIYSHRRLLKVANFTPKKNRISVINCTLTYLPIGDVDPKVYVSEGTTANPPNNPVFAHNKQLFTKRQHLLERRHIDGLSLIYI